jgi:tetratricopeptide (TPR) repeat protein
MDRSASHRILISSIIFTLILVWSAANISACPWCEKGREKYQSTKAVLVEGMGKHHHPVSTTNAEAQCFFDQGLAYCFAFNHDEAVRSFRRAAELDTTLAMAWWGIAYALGTNYNLPTDSARMARSHEAVQEGMKRLEWASASDKRYLTAIAARVTSTWDGNTKRLDSAYANAMRAVYEAEPDDLDAAVFYAEALMNLRPWQLYSIEGIAGPESAEIERILADVLKRNPDHAGAHHFFIHATEASPNPERALMSAYQLPSLIPAAGHLVHMPAHVFIRTGDYIAAVEANRQAIDIDSVYVANNGGQGFYSILYVPHNIHFYAVACAMAGMKAEALRACEKMNAYIEPFVKIDPMAEGVAPTHLLLLTKFGEWEKIAAYPKPDTSLHVVTSIWHFAQGVMSASKGNLKQAEKHLAMFRTEQSRLLPNAMMGAVNPASLVMPIAEARLLAAIEIAKGAKGDPVPFFERAIDLQRGVIYDEPEAWYLSSRESLGGYFLKTNQAGKAEAVFRADLKQYARSGRSLFGLVESLKMQGRNDAAAHVSQEFESSWQKADVTLSVASLQ